MAAAPSSERSSLIYTFEPYKMIDSEQISPKPDIKEDISRLIMEEPLTEDFCIKSDSDVVGALKVEDDTPTMILPKVEKDASDFESYEGSEREGEIYEKHEPIPQVWIKQEIKQETHDPSQVTDEQKLQSENIPDSSDECMAENERMENGDEVKNEEETDLWDVKSVHETIQDRESSASDVQASLEAVRMKYCCRQNMLLGRNCDICNKPMVKDCCRQNKLLGKNCDICRKPTDIQNLKYKCEICDIGYSNKYRLQTHLIVHRDDKFQCDICLKLFLNQRNLDKHKQSMHCGESKCICPKCGKGFKRNYALKRHLVSHSARRSYVCFLCNKSFKLRAHLLNHEQFVHSGERKCLCTTCGKGFQTQYSLKRHLVCHSSIRSYSCSLCNKLFKTKRLLAGHLAVHIVNNRSSV